MKEGLPETLMEFLYYVRRYEDGIYIRDREDDGSWGAISLKELSIHRWATVVAKWLEEGHMPVRVREDWELKEKQQ